MLRKYNGKWCNLVSFYNLGRKEAWSCEEENVNCEKIEKVIYMNKFLFPAAVALMATACNAQHDESTLAAWQPGEMDIHFIYTGRGEANFVIMPDGTTMLIDAGDWDPKTYPMMCDALPDSSLRSGEWIARYIDRVNPEKGNIDYLMVSHFHSDHTGDATNNAPMTEGRNPDYMLTGIAMVGESNAFGHAVDRGYPDYNYPTDLHDAHVDNYLAAMKWQKETKGMQQEPFKVGQRNQIKLLHDADKYKDSFSILNVAASGEVMTGDSTVRCYDLNPANLNYNNENTRSIVVRMDYGPFSFYTGGDVTGKLLDAEGNRFFIDSIVGVACGEVDVCKVNHHGYKDAMSKGFLDNVKARQYVMAVWDWQHTQPSIMGRIKETRTHADEPLVFTNNVPDTLMQAYAAEPWMENMCRDFGHIVVRVSEGGKSYRIFVVDATDETMHVKASYGPFKS